MRNVALAAGLLFACLTLLRADSPVLKSFLPAAIAPGATAQITFLGENLNGPLALWTSFNAETTFPEIESDGNRLDCQLTVPASVPVGIGGIRLLTTNGLSSLFLFMLDDLPLVQAGGNNKSLDAAQSLTLPVAVAGICPELRSQFFKIRAAKGQRVSVDVVAERMGSRLDPMVRLLDPAGRELAYCDDDPSAGRDPRLLFQCPAAGDYFLELRDITYEGGDAYRYHLRLGQFPLASIGFPLCAVAGKDTAFEIFGSALPAERIIEAPVPANKPAVTLNLRNKDAPGAGFVTVTASENPVILEHEPNDALRGAHPVTMPVTVNGRFNRDGDRDYYRFEGRKGDRVVIQSRTRSLGAPCDVYMQLQRADGSRIAEAALSNSAEAALTNVLEGDGPCWLMVEELNRAGAPDFAYCLDIETLRPGFELFVETDHVEAPVGGEFKLKINCVRQDYDGPIVVLLGTQNIDLKENVIAAKKNEVTLTARLPDDWDPGRIIEMPVLGHANIGDRAVRRTATLSPALRKLFPEMLFPPIQFETSLVLGVLPRAPQAKAGAKTEKE